MTDLDALKVRVAVLERAVRDIAAQRIADAAPLPKGPWVVVRRCEDGTYFVPNNRFHLTHSGALRAYESYSHSTDCEFHLVGIGNLLDQTLPIKTYKGRS